MRLGDGFGHTEWWESRQQRLKAMTRHTHWWLSQLGCRGLQVVNGLISAIRAEERDANKKWRIVLNPRLEGGDSELLKSHWYHTNSYSFILSFLLKGKCSHFSASSLHDSCSISCFIMESIFVLQTLCWSRYVACYAVHSLVLSSFMDFFFCFFQGVDGQIKV